MQQEPTVTERHLRAGKSPDDGKAGRPDPFATFSRVTGGHQPHSDLIRNSGLSHLLQQVIRRLGQPSAGAALAQKLAHGLPVRAIGKRGYEAKAVRVFPE